MNSPCRAYLDVTVPFPIVRFVNDGSYDTYDAAPCAPVGPVAPLVPINEKLITHACALLNGVITGTIFSIVNVTHPFALASFDVTPVSLYMT